MNKLHLSVAAATFGLVLAALGSEARAQGELYQPVFSDFHTQAVNSDDIRNSAIQFGKVLTFGVQRNLVDGMDDPQAAGLFFRPDLGNDDELVLGTSIRELDGSSTEFELQAKYTFASGIGFAGGFYRNGQSGDNDHDVFFARVNYEMDFAGGSLTLSPLAQRNPNADYDLGAVAVYNSETLLAGYGYNGEEVRGVVNYAFPKGSSPIRPAAEIFYFNEATGNLGGSDGAIELVLATGTLGFSGGFLAKVNSFGRASGTSAVTFANPVSFTSATWNRAYDVWEYGSYVNFRIQSVKFNLATGGEARQTDYSTAIYPANIIPGDQGPAERIFLGYRHIENEGSDDSDAPLVGYYGTLFGKWSTAVSFYYDFQDDQSEIVFGLSYLH